MSDLITSADEETNFAKQVLENRPKTKENRLPVKCGVKYSENHQSNEELSKIENHFFKLEKALSLWTVRRLENLGHAIWLPNLKVAKVVKQRKFMQTKCHYHEKGFFALYPEEALFLLDIGDIELTCGGAVLGMQDAYNLLLCARPEDGLCTMDEYQVYAHMSRIGYRVQRFSAKKLSEDADVKDNPENSMKRPLSPEFAVNQIRETKLCKTSDQLLVAVSDKSQYSLCTDKTDVPVTLQCNSRGWWLVPQEAGTGKFRKLERIKHVHCSNQADFLNFKDLDGSICVQEQPAELIPSGASAYKCEIPKVWKERLTPDSTDSGDALYPDDFSHARDIDYKSICRYSVDWANYKEMVKQATQELTLKIENLCKEMHSGLVKPILHPTEAYRTRCVLDKLKILDQQQQAGAEKKFETSSFSIKFNVYQTHKTKPFKKTNPGKPYLRLVVCSSSDLLPSLAELTHLKHLTEGVPIKLAVVDFGHIMFLGFDSIQLPTDILLG